MGLFEELKGIDCERFDAIFTDIFEDPANASLAFIEQEIAYADSIPALRLLFEKVVALCNRETKNSMSGEKLKGILVGVDIARIALTAYAASEVADKLPVSDGSDPGTEQT